MINDIIACVGLMFIIKYGTILTWYRNFVSSLHPQIAELHKCSLCLGFWCGVVVMCFELHFNSSNQSVSLIRLLCLYIVYIVYMGFHRLTLRCKLTRGRDSSLRVTHARPRIIDTNYSAQYYARYQL